ncbi:MAG: hypothetical protein MUP02_08240 [Actinobacteria bacterium]|nr:hypothetical protein [Actinomycetota bacterium]
MPSAKRFNIYFRDFGYRVIRLKYFIMIVAALFLEVATLSIYLLKSENMLDFEIFTIAILYGITSSIIVVLAVGVLVLMKTDKRHDIDKIRALEEFKINYAKLSNRHSPEINDLVSRFDGENSSIDIKINYASVLEEKYDKFLQDFLKLKTPSFLNYAFSCETDHLRKEKEFYNGFSMFLKRDVLNSISSESEIARTNFLRELTKIEKNLQIII